MLHSRLRQWSDWAWQFKNNSESIEAHRYEVTVYCQFARIPSLSGRIPKLHSWTKQAIFLEFAEGNTLRKAAADLTDEQFVSLKATLLSTISLIHKSGVCHGDISLDNIMTPSMLIDFSHAKLKQDLSTADWDTLISQDWDALKKTFAEAALLKVVLYIPAIRRWNWPVQDTRAALQLLDGGADDFMSQKKLAKALQRANVGDSCRLIDRYRKIERPTSFLALEIARQLRRNHQYKDAVKLFKNLPSEFANGSDRRTRIKLLLELARCQSSVDPRQVCTSIDATITLSKKTFGDIDGTTLQLRHQKVNCLCMVSNYLAAMSECHSALSDLKQKKACPEADRRRLKDWIGLFRQEWSIANRRMDINKRHAEHDKTGQSPPRKKVCTSGTAELSAIYSSWSHMDISTTAKAAWGGTVFPALSRWRLG